MSILQIAQKYSVFLQILISFVAIFICFYDVEQKQIIIIIKQISMPLLSMALLIKTIGLLIREARLWLILEEPRPSFSKTMYIGLATGMLHTFLPLRGADIVSIGMLHQYCDVDISKGSVAVALSGFFEMLVFGVFLIGILTFQPFWYEVLGEQIFHKSLFSTTTLLLAGIFMVSALAFRGRKNPPPTSETSPVREFFEKVVSHTHKAVAIKNLIVQLSLSTVEIILMIVSFVVGLWSLSIDIEAPFGTVSIVLALSAISAIALPPSYGAGPAASIAFVLDLVGCSAEESFAYAGLWWILSQIPTISTGLPSYWFLQNKKYHGFAKESG